MAYKFKAIEQDKKTINTKSDKVLLPPSQFGGTLMDNTTFDDAKIWMIDLDLINERSVNDFSQISLNTLKASIQQIGLITPIALRDTENGRYTIISGHRRWSAYKSILRDKKIELENKKASNLDYSSVLKDIEKYEKIPAIVYQVVAEDSRLLGTDPKYITKDQEEEMYKAANLESRQISKEQLIKHIDYFYKMIESDPSFKTQLLNERNSKAERKATKLNMPDVLSTIITKDLGFPVAATYVWRYVWIIESGKEYKAYYDIAKKRLDKGEQLHTVFKDFKMALEIYKDIDSDNFDDKKRALTRIERGNEKIEDVYNEYFNKKPQKKEKKTYKQKDVLNILMNVKSGKITIEEAIQEVKK